MTFAQITEKRNRILAEAGTIAQGKDKTAETRAKLTGMLAEADTLAEDAKIAKALETHADELRSSGRPPRGEIGATNQAENEQRAFRDWMRTGTISAENRTYLSETRDLGSFTGVGMGTNTITSSVLVPVGFDPLLAIAQKSYGQLVSAVRHLETATGEPIKYALSDDTENSLTLLPTEITPVTEVDPNLTGGVSYVDDLTTGLVKVSNNLLNDSAFSVSDFISQTFGARYFRGMAQMIQQGNGSHIASIAANVPVGATSAITGGFEYADLVNLFSALNPAFLDRASWLLSPAARAALLLMVDAYNRPLLQNDADGTPFSSLFGRPLVISTYADPVAAGKTPLIFGDLTSYTLRTVSDGLQIVRLNERYAETNETGFLGRVRAGGYSVLQAASPALVSLQMHSS